MGWKHFAHRMVRKAGIDVIRYREPSAESSPGAPSWSTEAIRGYLSDVERPVVFDVGANIGQSVELYRHLLPGCEIHAFEPSPTTFRQLQTVGASDVRLINAAVGSVT